MTISSMHQEQHLQKLLCFEMDLQSLFVEILVVEIGIFLK